MNEIEVSIIMGIYNCQEYIIKSIESIINQSYTKWELIMCDDGSSDNTYAVAKEIMQQYPNKIYLLKNEKNMGLNYTLNKCLKKARGKYIARQDGDDISLPQRLEKEVSFLNEHPEYSLVSTDMVCFDDKNGEWGNSHYKEKPENIDFVKGSPFCHASAMIRKEAMEAVNGYIVDEKFLRVEDYYLWFELYERGYKGYNINEALYKVRDDKEAYARRTWRNRINEVRVKKLGFKMLNISIKYYPYIYRPILVGLLPRAIYNKLHKAKLYKN